MYTCARERACVRVRLSCDRVGFRGTSAGGLATATNVHGRRANAHRPARPRVALIGSPYSLLVTSTSHASSTTPSAPPSATPTVSGPSAGSECAHDTSVERVGDERRERRAAQHHSPPRRSDARAATAAAVGALFSQYMISPARAPPFFDAPRPVVLRWTTRPKGLRPPIADLGGVRMVQLGPLRAS
jgi:hypothetical protein